MIALLAGLALAAPSTESFSLRQTVSCPAVGVCRVEVPAPMIAANPSSWMLVDARGELVPFAVLREAENPHLRPARIRATPDPEVVGVPVPEGSRASELRVRISAGRFLASARLESRRGGEAWRRGPEVVLAAGLVDEVVARIPNPDLEADELRLVFDQPWVSLPATAEFTLVLWDRDELAPARLTLPLEAAGPGQDGRSRYTFRLPELAQIQAVELSPEESTYDRTVALESWEPSWEGLTLVARAHDQIRRTRAEDPSIQHIDAGQLVADRFALSVEDEWDLPLTIKSVDALLARRVLLVEDAGEMTLYGGDSAWVAEFDLQLRYRDLSMSVSTDARLGALEANPAWRDPFDGGALEPGSVVDPARFRFSRTVSGQGISRIPVPFDVMLNSRPGRSDLRLLDPENQQIPYIRDWGAHPAIVQGVEQTVEEAGKLTRVRLKLPGQRTPITSITIDSPDGDFTRQVRVFTGDGAGRRLLTDTSWTGRPAGPSRRTLALDTTAEGGLLIEVDHGDNRPITLGTVLVYAPTETLLARLPEGEVRMVYGDVADVQGRVQGPFKGLRENGWEEPLDMPQYDATALASRLARVEAGEASLGEPVEQIKEASATDRTVANVGIGVLVLGLIALVGWLLKDLRTSGGPEGA